jgi:glycosyltransferase involved in cell wall biosynthesis
MTHRAPISAVLITLNAERHLSQVLSALAGCAEIVILDSGSSDATQAIARDHGAFFAQRTFDGYGPQKRSAVALAKHDWVLLIDADETVDAELAAALGSADLRDPQRAYRMRRRNFVGSQEIRHGIFGNEYVTRLFNRTVANISDDAVHEAVRGAPHLATVPGSILHASFSDGADLFLRMAKYARTKATVCRATGRRAAAPLLVLRAGWAFFRCYVLKGGFRDGRLGVLVALSAACDAVVGLAMAAYEERQNNASPP